MKRNTLIQTLCAVAVVCSMTTHADVLIAAANAYGYQNAPDTIQSTAAQLNLNNGTPTSRKIYLRFDTSSLPADVLTASLIFDYKAGVLDDDVRVNLLNDGVNETWDKSSLTWNNAPGNNTASGSGFNGALTTLLTTTPPPGGLVDGSNVTILSGSILVDLINNERNGIGGLDGLITFALGRNGGSNAAIHSLEGAIARGAEQPRIVYTVIPEPATLGLMGLVGGVAIFIRKRFMI